MTVETQGTAAGARLNLTQLGLEEYIPTGRSGKPPKFAEQAIGEGIDRFSSNGGLERQKIVNSYDGWETDV